MMYYVKQSDPSNGLLSCLSPLTSTTITHTETHSYTHTQRESLDSLSVIELSSNHIYNAAQERDGGSVKERQTRTGAQREGVCVGVRVEVVLLS